MPVTADRVKLKGRGITGGTAAVIRFAGAADMRASVYPESPCPGATVGIDVSGILATGDR